MLYEVHLGSRDPRFRAVLHARAGPLTGGRGSPLQQVRTPNHDVTTATPVAVSGLKVLSSTSLMTLKQDKAASRQVSVDVKFLLFAFIDIQVVKGT